MTHALPLIPPTDHSMSLKDCDDESKNLKKIHTNAINKFWGQLKTSDKSDYLNRVELDLYALYSTSKQSHRSRDQWDSPGRDEVAPIWDKIIASLDNDELQKKLHLPAWSDPDLVLVAIMTGEDERVTLVHRYEGERIYSSDDGILSVNGDDGPNWFYEPSFYEPEHFDEGSYSVPCLYLVGTLDDETQAWEPKNVTFEELLEIRDRTREMESLLENDRLPSYCEYALPSFPSGVETRLQELKMLRNYLYVQKSATADEETAAICLAGQPFEKPIADLNAQIEVLRELLEAQEALKNHAQQSAFLAFHGYECGQVVTNAATGETGILTILDETRQTRGDVIVLVEGKEPEGAFTRHRYKSQLRDREWTVVDADMEPSCPAP